MADALDADLRAAGYPTLYNSATSAGDALDHMSVADWIDSRVPGGHASPLGALLDAAYAIEYGADTRQQASLNLVYLLGFQGDPNSLAVFGESDERFHIRGGNQRLPQAIAAALGDDVVQTGWRLTRIRKTAGGRTALSFDVGAHAREVVADVVVLAIPFAVLRELDYDGAGFDALKTTAIRELGRGHNGKMHLQFANRTWTKPGPWGLSNGSSYADTGYQSGWEVSRAQPGKPGILVCYSGGSVTDAMRANVAFAPIGGNPRVADDAARSLAQLEPVFPGVSAQWNGKATQSLPHLSSFFNCSYSYWRVGQYTKFSGYEAAPQGNILFCGEHTSTDFQGFMEGGASTGEQAAVDVRRLVRGQG
jgi:monoamine oxidase